MRHARPTQAKFYDFVTDSGVELGRVMEAATGGAPEMGVRRGDKRALCFAFSRSWSPDAIYPLPFGSGLLARKAAGFVAAHECDAAKKALESIMERHGASLESLGRAAWELALPETYREIVRSGALCDEDEWASAFNGFRGRLPAGICVTLALGEDADGRYSASASVALNSARLGTLGIIELERGVESMGDVRQLAREALGHVFPWVMSPEMDAEIAERDGAGLRKALLECGEGHLPDIPRWIDDMTANLELAVRERADRDESGIGAPPERPGRPAMRM